MRAFATYLMVRQHIPVARCAELLSDALGAPVSTGWLAGLSAEAAETQQQYLQALGWLDGHCFSQYEKPFIQLSPAQQGEVLTLLTHENDNPEMAHGVKLFRIVKNSIVEAYYSSEIGMLQELKYETNPFQSEYPGCKNPDEHK